MMATPALLPHLEAPSCSGALGCNLVIKSLLFQHTYISFTWCILINTLVINQVIWNLNLQLLTIHT